MVKCKQTGTGKTGKPSEQSRLFIEKAREIGADEGTDSAEVNEALGRSAETKEQ